MQNTEGNQNQESSPQIIPESPVLKPKQKRRNYDRKVHGNRYSIVRKLAVKSLVQSGMSPSDIERQEGIDRSTVYDIMKDKRISILSNDQVNNIKRSLTGMMYGNAYRAQEKITDDKLNAMNAYQLSLISSINVDKSRLMEGLSTDNIAHRGFVEHLEDDRKRLMDKIEKSFSLEDE